MSRREVSRPPVRAVYHTTMAPESGADLVPPVPAPVPGRPGGTDSLICSSGQYSEVRVWVHLSRLRLLHGDLMIRGEEQPIMLRRLMVVQHRHQLLVRRV